VRPKTYNPQDPRRGQQWAADHHRSAYGGTVTANAPFGTSDDGTEYYTHMRPGQSNQNLLNISESTPFAGVSSWSGASVRSCNDG